jgi:hypothetical protein
MLAAFMIVKIEGLALPLRTDRVHDALTRPKLQLRIRI